MKAYLILTFIIISSTLLGQNGPKIEFKAVDNTIDYGKVYKEDDNGLRVFEFTNTGNEPLIITNVKSSCGCTVPSKPTEPILPGETSKIEVKYNMKLGKISKSITVDSNAINAEDGKVVLKIIGEVIEKPVENLLEKKVKSPLMMN